MSFQQAYPTLWNFFAGYFPDADLDSLTDEEVVADYKADCRDGKTLYQTRAELQALLADPASWEDAANEANRYLPSGKEQLNWLQIIEAGLAK